MLLVAKVRDSRFTNDGRVIYRLNEIRKGNTECFVSIQRIKSALIMAAIEISLGPFTQFRNLPGPKKKT